MDLLSIVSQPITQVGVIVGIITAFQKAGFDVWGALSAFLQLKPTKELIVDGRETAQATLTKLELLMTQLGEHYNHETTEILERIVTKLGDMHDCLKQANRKLDEQDKFGVKIRKE